MGTSSDPWRDRCPEGHAALEVYGGGYRCKACDEYYPGEPFDAAEDTFPVEGADPAPTITVATVLRALYHETRDTDTTVAAADIDERTRVVGTKLHAARERGLVERLGASSPYRWRLTRDGYNKARPLRNSLVKDLLRDKHDDLGMSPVSGAADK